MALRRWKTMTGALLTLALVGAMQIGGAAPASAASCTGDVTYSSTSNAIHLVTAGKTYSLAGIAAACAAAPLVEVSPDSDIWELSADLIVQHGAISSPSVQVRRVRPCCRAPVAQLVGQRLHPRHPNLPPTTAR